jgi:hypothetical protein
MAATRVAARTACGRRSCGLSAAYISTIRSIIENKGLESQWGYALEAEVVILNELRESEARERRALSNKLKPIIAAPPETLTINRKGCIPTTC